MVEEYLPEARAELLDACRLLEADNAGLGQSLLDEVCSSIALLLQSPGIGRLVHPEGVRRQPLRRFRYNLLYVVDNDRLIVLAIAHQSRHPDYWLERL